MPSLSLIGIAVDQSRGMLGTFAPQKAPYVHTLEEETTPSGVLARGVYTAKLKVRLVHLSILPRITLYLFLSYEAINRWNIIL